MKPSKRCAQALATLSQAGRLPNFGDDDGGRVIVSPCGSVPPASPRPVGRIYSMVSKDSQLFYRRRPARCLDCGSWPCGRAEHPTHYRRSPEADRFRYLSATSAPNATASAALRPTTRFRWMAAIKLNPKALSLGRTCLKPSSSAGMLPNPSTSSPAVITVRPPHPPSLGLRPQIRFWLVRDLVTGDRPTTRDRRGASTTSKSTGTFWRSTTRSFCLQLATIGPNQSSHRTGPQSMAKRNPPSSGASVPKLSCPPNSLCC